MLHGLRVGHDLTREVVPQRRDLLRGRVRVRVRLAQQRGLHMVRVSMCRVSISDGVIQP